MNSNNNNCTIWDVLAIFLMSRTSCRSCLSNARRSLSISLIDELSVRFCSRSSSAALRPIVCCFLHLRKAALAAVGSGKEDDRREFPIAECIYKLVWIWQTTKEIDCKEFQASCCRLSPVRTRVLASISSCNYEHLQWGANYRFIGRITSNVPKSMYFFIGK